MSNTPTLAKLLADFGQANRDYARTNDELAFDRITELHRQILAAHEAEVRERMLELLKWTQKFPNGRMVISHPDRDAVAVEVEYHAVPTKEVVKRINGIKAINSEAEK